MNIKELANIGAKEAVKKQQEIGASYPNELTIQAGVASYFEMERPSREAFAQAVLDAYRKSVDEPAPIKDKWKILADAYKAGNNLEWRRPADGIHNWQAVTWDGDPHFNHDNEYRIAPSLDEDDMLKKRVHELMAINTELQKELEALRSDKERQEFEAFAQTRRLPLDKVNLIYKDESSQDAWEAWKAARKTK